MLNVENMKAIQSCFYSLHENGFEIISNKFGQPILHGLIEHKTVLKLFQEVLQLLNETVKNAVLVNQRR